MILWPVLFAAVLAFDVAVWRVCGDSATASAWLQAWAASSPYHVLWFFVAWAWFAAHVVAGADLWALALPLDGLAAVSWSVITGLAASAGAWRLYQMEPLATQPASDGGAE